MQANSSYLTVLILTVLICISYFFLQLQLPSHSFNTSNASKFNFVRPNAKTNDKVQSFKYQLLKTMGKQHLYSRKIQNLLVYLKLTQYTAQHFLVLNRFEK